MKQTKVTDIAIKPSAEGIIASMEAQLKNPKSKQKWDSPFKRRSGIGKNAFTGNYYQGSNLFLTMFDVDKNKYPHAIYATKKQWKQLKCEVKDNAPSLPITFWKNITEDSKRIKGKKVVVSSFCLYSRVYNVKFIEGNFKVPEFKTGKQYSIKLIDDFVKATKVELKHDNNQGCFYSPKKDFINMEYKTNFKDTEESNATVHYYSTLFHELTHASGHESRTNRIKTNLNKFGLHSTEYAFEELVAEIGSILLGHQFNIEKTVRDNHAKYLNSWIKALKKDYTLIATAFAQAQKGVDKLEKIVKDSVK
jgi:antirestriction protein ArdC